MQSEGKELLIKFSKRGTLIKTDRMTVVKCEHVGDCLTNRKEGGLCGQ